MTQLSIRPRQSGSVTILDLAGNLTFADCDGVLRDAVRRTIDQGSKRILLNVADVALIRDVAGIKHLKLERRRSSGGGEGGGQGEGGARNP